MEELVVAINNLSNKTFVDYLIAFAPIVISIVAICVSISATREQNKISLLEKRLEIYTNLQKCISNVIVEGKSTTQNAKMFIVKARDVKFLFGPEVEELCNEIYKSMLELRCIGIKVETVIDGDKNMGDHVANCDKEVLLLNKMFGYNELLEKAVMPYISFKKAKKHQKIN